MVRRKTPTPEELTNSRDARVALGQLDRQERYVATLRLAQHLQMVSNPPSHALRNIIREAEADLITLRSRVGGRIIQRKRPKKTPDPLNTCTVFLDECGQHVLNSNDPFGAFVLGAVIIRDDHLRRVEQRWRDWKTTHLGSPNKIVHEPDVRRGNGAFWLQGNRVRQSEVKASLQQVVSELEFVAIACVINRAEYVTQCGTQALDNSLPTHPYLMALDFLMERLVMGLETQFDGARAHVIAEGRGPLEDARLQGEYVRLLEDGTTYISDSWFRQALGTGIEFRTKNDNVPGLQIADLLVRPCGEKVLNPQSTPDRWLAFRPKLCLGQETAHSILGLKIVPWHERYERVWES